MPDIIEGRNAIIEALRSGREFNRILLARTVGRHSSIAELLHLARQHGVPFEFVDQGVIERNSPTGTSQGVIAFVAVKEYASLESLLALAREKGEAPLLCVLDGVEDPNNLGAVLRSADGAGFHGVVIRERRAVGLTAAVARASAGAVEYVPVARVANIAETITLLKKQNVWVWGIDMAAKEPYDRIDYTVPCAVVVGGEGQGLSELVRKRCDSLAHIPMRGKVSSLNVSVAAALVMYEALRQRSRPK
jgi:23S rRNA (guanosine2251-2'-O)-methyltransferase